MAVTARCDDAKSLCECPVCFEVHSFGRPFACPACGFSAVIRRVPAELEATPAPVAKPTLAPTRKTKAKAKS